MNQEWEALRQEVLNCRKCGLCAERTNAVFGVGNPNAKVVFIGEGPGAQEDATGEPFVGRSGQLLDKMLAYAGFSRNKNIFIANMVKCRPPQNRDPAKDEIEQCIGYLRRQVRLIQPRVLVCVGRIAASSIISPDYKVTKEHGTFLERNGVLLMGTFHPAALLRNPSNKPAAMEDLMGLRARLIGEGICSEEELAFPLDEMRDK